jgi:hypothetical protein
MSGRLGGRHEPLQLLDLLEGPVLEGDRSRSGL